MNILILLKAWTALPSPCLDRASMSRLRFIARRWSGARKRRERNMPPPFQTRTSLLCTPKLEIYEESEKCYNLTLNGKILGGKHWNNVRTRVNLAAMVWKREAAGQALGQRLQTWITSADRFISCVLRCKGYLFNFPLERCAEFGVFWASPSFAPQRVGNRWETQGGERF